MNIRSFFKCLPFVPLAAKAVIPKSTLRPPIYAFPPEHEVVGLIAQAWNHDEKNWSTPAYLILREFDDGCETWRGQHINNVRRNKYWGKSLNGGPEVLLCFDRWDHDIRFFKNEPNTDWSLIGKGIKW